MLSLLLVEKILSMYIILFLGVILVKSGVVKASDSIVLSKIGLYIVFPCVLLSSLWVEQTPELLNGMLIAFIGGIVLHIVAISLAKIMEKPLHLNAVDKASIVYTNSGSLILPLIVAILGSEYTAYSLGYIVVQNILFWTHMRNLLSGENKPDLKKMLLNPTMISIVFALIIFAAKVELPAIVKGSISSITDLNGPMSMLGIGMIIGGMKLKEVFVQKKVWMISALRLIAAPLIFIVVLKLIDRLFLGGAGETVFLITLLVASAPTASTIVKMTQVFSGNEEYASAINVVSTMLCVATLPLIAMLYQL